ncbi:Myb_DNA-bind_4 domain-containing protein [Cephalotus follicularis]|uniref:Myb_DNA-bind_4 domain-containing protein n=1 Tax=Cephalotus follicularis TaxID=3775 RepID=A0A1Q3CV83_CEPFO|nr:Myb_DNA-bind_4 domain-containing protein [Cephalotus follicularis]
MESLSGTLARPPSTAPLPIREDCWSEDATFTLLEAWGDRYLELNRGNLRQKHWQEVADSVNDLHGHVSSKSHRTDIQCKNRIDTLKKKYKIEKARVLDSNGAYTSQWPFFDRLDALLRSNFQANRPSPPVIGTPSTTRRTPPLVSPGWPFSPVPVGLRSSKRPSPAQASSLLAPAPLPVDDSQVRRNLSAFAAAAAAAAAEDSQGSDSRSSYGRERGGEREEGYRELAEAIERLGDIYERVESKKQKQMVDLEKQRMQFAKELECQRMQLFMETQLQLQKINCVKPSRNEPDILSSERKSKSAFVQFGAAWNLLAMEGYSLCRELGGDMNF